MAIKFTAVDAATLAAGTPAAGEYVRTTDTNKFYMGDGSTQGGVLIGPGHVLDGGTLTTGLTFPVAGLHILDTNASHDLIISPGSDLSADRTLTITTGDASRTLTINGDVTLPAGTALVAGDVDDTPVNGETAVPVSSNWAYDHAALTQAHGISAFGATLVDDADAATARTTLGLVIGTNVQAYDADLTTWAGVTPGTGVTTFLTTPSSANLASAVTDETGSGALCFGTNPTLTGATLAGTLDGDGQEIARNLTRVVAVDNSSTGVTLTAGDHSGCVITTNGTNTITVPTTAGFNCVIKAGAAHTVTFNSTASAAMASGDLMTLFVESSTVIHAVLTASANKVTFSA